MYNGEAEPAERYERRNDKQHSGIALEIRQRCVRSSFRAEYIEAGVAKCRYRCEYSLPNTYTAVLRTKEWQQEQRACKLDRARHYRDIAHKLDDAFYSILSERFLQGYAVFESYALADYHEYERRQRHYAEPAYLYKNKYNNLP